ncbi:MAG: substrate-binding domain-containing protein [Thermomicrobiales bacterium]
MRGKRTITRLLVATLMLTLLASMPLATAAAPNRQDKKFKIAVSVPGLNFPFFVHVMDIAKTKSTELNVEMVQFDGKDDSNTQIADLESAISQGVDGVVVSPRDAAVATGIQSVLDAGIPVVTFDRNVSDVATLAHVGADNVRGGEKQGEYLIKILPNGGKIIELEGTTGASPAIDRDAGFKKALEGHSEYQIVFDQTAAFKRDQGLSVTENALQAHSDINAIVAANDDMASGAAEAVAGAGIKVPIIGFDALPETLQAIQAGTITATIEQWPGKQVSGAMQIMVDYLKDKKEPAQHDNFIDPTLIDASNLGQAERAAEAGISPSGTPVGTPAGTPTTSIWRDGLAHSPSFEPRSVIVSKPSDAVIRLD